MSNAMNDLLHTCRYCKAFKNGVCLNKPFVNEGGISPIQLFSEEGKIAEIIAESWTQVLYKNLNDCLNTLKVSQKVREEIVQSANVDVLIARHEWAEKIDANIVNALSEPLQEMIEADYIIRDPERFSCKLWE